MGTIRTWLVGLSLVLGIGLLSPAYAGDEAEVEALLRGTDDLLRGDSSVATMVMEVKTDRYERTVKMQAWTQGTDRSLVRILEPAKEQGISTLKVDDNIWNYLPKVDRVMKVPASMMSGSWMGSHFTNDDLVRDSRLSEDFACEITGRPADSAGNYVVACTPKPDTGRYVVELVPKPDAPVVWGKIRATFQANRLPTSVEYFDESGALVRTMSYSGYREVGGRQIPLEFRVVPADAPGEYTLMRYEEISFDAAIPEGTFSLQALRR